MNPQPQPLVSINVPHTRYGASFFSFNELPSSAPGQSPYYETDRIKALAVYAETGNASEAARQVGCSDDAVADWVNDERSGQIITELRSTIRYNEGWRLAKLVTKALDKVERRLEDGDEVVLKDGRIINRAAPLRDTVVAASILIDKWMLISGAISNETQLLGRMDDLSKQLTMMGGSLKSAAPSSPPDGTPIEDAPGENLIG